MSRRSRCRLPQANVPVYWFSKYCTPTVDREVIDGVSSKDAVLLASRVYCHWFR